MEKTDMKKKIVVALDGSDTARNAAETAIQIAAAASLMVEGFYIVDENLILDPYANYSKELGSDPGLISRDSLVELFEQVGFPLLDQLENLCISYDVRCITNLLFGGVPELILENARQASFLALGRRGNSHAAEKDHLGGNFHRIAHHAKIPMIVGGDSLLPIKQILWLYDGDPSSLATYWVSTLQDAFSGKLMVGLMGENDSNDGPETIDAKLVSMGINVDVAVDLRSKAMDEIVAATNDSQADLIIMGGYHRPEIVAWLIGSPIDEILRGNPLPVLIV
jgi:nucleotide-binding universal stress UspA family protein